MEIDRLIDFDQKFLSNFRFELLHWCPNLSRAIEEEYTKEDTVSFQGSYIDPTKICWK